MTHRRSVHHIIMLPIFYKKRNKSTETSKPSSLIKRINKKMEGVRPEGFESPNFGFEVHLSLVRILQNSPRLQRRIE